MNTLKHHYYGNNIQLKQAANIADTGNSYPGYALEQGANGPEVTEIQNQLNRIAANYPMMPPVPANGIFDEATSDALQSFQKIFNLPETGVADEATWNKLNEIYNGLGIESANTGGVLPAYPGEMLEIGSRGDNVRFIQSVLNAISEKYPSIPKVAEDGIYEDDTVQQVREFQKLFGLIDDGVVGPETWNQIMTVYSGIDNGSVSPVAPKAPDYPGYIIKQGNTGEATRTLQRYLNELANIYPTIPRVVADGAFGPGTKAAVIEAQKALSLTPDGMVGPTSWDAIVKGAAPLPPAYGGVPLRLGSVGDDVKTLQSYINKLADEQSGPGARIPRLAVDGVFGEDTRNAVIAAQHLLGLPEDGIVAKDTWNAIVR